MLVETAATGGRVSQRAVKRIRGFPHQQQERSRSFQSKGSVLKEGRFLFSFGMRCSYFLSGTPGNRYLLNLCYFIFVFINFHIYI